MARPGELALGVTPRVVLGAVGSMLQRNLAVEMPNQPRHAMRFHDRKQRIKLARCECAYFIECTASEHRVEARINAAAQLQPLRREKDLQGVRGIKRGRRAMVVPLGERPPGRL